MARRSFAFSYLVAVAVWLGSGLPAGAQDPVQESLEIGLSTDVIAITSDFAGADITIFGALDRADQVHLALGLYDIIVTLEGPPQRTTVRKKERTFGIWINRRSMQFEPLPTSYSLSSTRPIDLITTPLELSALNLGSEYLRMVPTGFGAYDSELPEFRDALERLRRSSGLFQRDFEGIDFVSSSLFKASVRLPANIPVGEHRLKAYLFKQGKYLMQRELRLRVVKTGIEQYLNRFAHDQSLLYGIFAVLLAGLTGWLGSVVFRRD